MQYIDQLWKFGKYLLLSFCMRFHTDFPTIVLALCFIQRSQHTLVITLLEGLCVHFGVRRYRSRCKGVIGMISKFVHCVIGSNFFYNYGFHSLNSTIKSHCHIYILRYNGIGFINQVN